MDKINAFLHSLEDWGVNIGLLIAGCFGAILSLKDKEGLTLWNKMFAVFAGMTIANYGCPIIFEYIKINEGVKYGVGFVLGFIGYESMKWLIAIVNGWMKKK